MHEFSIAAQLVDSLLEFVESRPPGEVLKVRMEIGELTCVEPDQLKFCFDAIKAETVLKNAALEITRQPAVVKCAHCDYEGVPKYWQGERAAGFIPTLECPECGKATQAIQGHDCEIKTIQWLDLASAEAAARAAALETEVPNECGR